MKANSAIKVRVVLDEESKKNRISAERIRENVQSDLNILIKHNIYKGFKRTK